jgi:hypothetical protein
MTRRRRLLLSVVGGVALVAAAAWSWESQPELPATDGNSPPLPRRLGRAKPDWLP